MSSSSSDPTHKDRRDRQPPPEQQREGEDPISEKQLVYFVNCCFNSCVEQSHSIRKAAAGEQLSSKTIHPAMTDSPAPPPCSSSLPGSVVLAMSMQSALFASSVSSSKCSPDVAVFTNERQKMFGSGRYVHFCRFGS